jgi:hypothetical protein
VDLNKWLECGSLLCSLALAMTVLETATQSTQTAVGQSQHKQQSPVNPSPPNAAANNTETEITTQTPDAQIKVHVNLVLVHAVVRDLTGKEVAGLKKKDFKLLDNGKEQE